MRVVKEPLLHFLVLGAVLFGLYGIFGKKETVQPAKLVVSAAQIANLQDGFARTWQRQPTVQELEGLIEGYIRSEIYYREAKAIGLDRDDPVIRNRLRQKMEFIAEDTAAAEPNDDELSAYLASHSEKFKSEDRLSFHHRFLNASRRATLNDDIERAKLAKSEKDIDVEAMGDRFLLGDAFRDMAQSEVSRTFGDRFAEKVFAQEPGRWQGPIPSGYGLHFVFVDERTPGKLPPLDTVRKAVSRELMNARRVEAQEKLYRMLRGRYEITVETLAVEPESGKDLAGAAQR